MKKAVLIMFILSYSLLVLGSEYVQVKKITFSQGLSENTIMDIAQDSLGYIWAGTREGLNRYDGYSCKNYFAATGKGSGLRSSSIQKIYIDKHSNIWVRNLAGIDVYDSESDSFKPLDIVVNNKSLVWVDDVCEVAGLKWLATPQSGLVAINSESNQVVYVSEYFKKVHSFCKQDDNHLWLYADSQLFLFDAQRQEIKSSLELPFSSSVLTMTWYENMLWLYSYDGLWIFDGQDFMTFRSFAQEHAVRPIDQLARFDEVLITRMIELEDKLWVSTDGNGIFIIDLSKGCIIENININSSARSISTNAIRCLFADRDKNIWAGTVHNGLNLIPHWQKQFCSLEHVGDNSRGPNGNFSNFLEDMDNSLWAASFDGLCRLDKHTMSIEQFVAKGIIINTITIDWEGDIFMGTYNRGLLKYTPTTGKIEKVQSSTFALNSSINALLTDQDGNVWIGTEGLFFYNKQTGEIRNMGGTGFTEVISLLEDENSRIWIGTVNGLFQFEPETGRIVSYGSNKNSLYKISNSWVNCLFEDCKGNIWLGTNGGGLNRIQHETHQITRFKNSGELSSNVVHGIAEDKQGLIWFTTNSGLVRLNPMSGEMDVYDYTDGLINNQYIDESLFLSSSGMMLCGGERGIDFFYPEKIIANPHPPRVIVNGNFFETGKSGDKVESHQRNLNINNSLTLKYNQSYFGFEFTGIDFANTQKIKYAYKLDGFNPEWNYVSDQRTVNYGHIPPGKYKFMVMAANSDSIWSESSTVDIVVKPPFTKTTLAYVLYILGLLLILLVTYRYLLERKLLKNKLQYESRERKRIEELNQLKLRLFTHVSHEFRTPLSLILAPVQGLLKRFSRTETSYRDLEIIYDNARKLQVLVDQVLEVRKIESGAIRLNKSNLEIVRFVKSCTESFQSWAGQKGIRLTCFSDVEEQVLNVDQSLIEKVVYNLLSNAIKYTEKGSVELCMGVDKQYFTLEVKDTGIGIAEEHRERLFEMFYRIDNENSVQEGSGVGLALCKELVELHDGKIAAISKPGEGSTFKVFLPLPEDRLKADVMSCKEDKLEIDAKNGFGNNALILLVDDNKELRTFLAEKLCFYFQIIEAENGKDALLLAREKQPQLIVSDVMMPEMNGWELCKQVKTDLQISHIQVVLLTALSDHENTIKGLETGADAYLTKPFNLDHVVSLLKNLLRSRAQMKAYFSKGQVEKINPDILTKLDKDFLESIQRNILENLSNPEFSVQMLSDLLNMSRVNLHHKLKALCDQSPSVYILRIRLTEAVKLLIDRKWQISEIADMTGFSTASHFSRVFKKQYGGSPSDFLKGKFEIKA